MLKCLLRTRSETAKEGEIVLVALRVTCHRKRNILRTFKVQTSEHEHATRLKRSKSNDAGQSGHNHWHNAQEWHKSDTMHKSSWQVAVDPVVGVVWPRQTADGFGG